MKNKLTLTTSLALVLLFAGCAHRLEPGGAYAPPGQQADFAFYVADAAYDLAYSAIDGAFKFEKENRADLWALSPNIKRTLDEIRPQAWEANVQWAKARKAYRANPTPEGLSAMQQALAKIQQLSAAAQAILPKGN